jgi:hypothetical protein
VITLGGTVQQRNTTGGGGRKDHMENLNLNDPVSYPLPGSSNFIVTLRLVDRIKGQNVWRDFQAIRRKAGILKCSFHDLRKSFVLIWPEWFLCTLPRNWPDTVNLQYATALCSDPSRVDQRCATCTGQGNQVVSMVQSDLILTPNLVFGLFYKKNKRLGICPNLLVCKY